MHTQNQFSAFATAWLNPRYLSEKDVDACWERERDKTYFADIFKVYNASEIAVWEDLC